jgi:uncharacterized delta-60 repeat protein
MIDILSSISVNGVQASIISGATNGLNITNAKLALGGDLINDTAVDLKLKQLDLRYEDPAFILAGTGFNSPVNVIAVQPDDKIVVGGQFIDYTGNTANYIIRLNSDSTIDNTFNSGIGFSAPVNAIAIQADGKILVGGQFTVYNGVNGAPYIARLHSNGTFDTGFTSSFDFPVNCIAIQADGKILVGGQFTLYNGMDSVGRIVRLNSDGSIDTTFNYPNSGFDTDVNTIVIQPNGKMLVGGTFSSYIDAFGPHTANKLVLLNSDGSQDMPFSINVNSGFDAGVNTIAIQSDSKIVVGGVFTAYSGITAYRMIRLNSDATIDTDFTILGFDNGSPTTIFALGIQTDGKIIAGGNFLTYGGDGPNNLTRINSNGTYDNTLIPNNSGFTGAVYATVIQRNGKILVGGQFNVYNGNIFSSIIRLNTNGTPNTGTTTNINLIFKDEFVEYARDNSLYYSDRSLVDKGYVLPKISEITSVNATGYTVQASDSGKIIEFTNASAITIILPTGLTTGFKATLVNVGGNNKTLAAGVNATLSTNSGSVIIANAYESATIYVRALNSWVGFGQLS